MDTLSNWFGVFLYYLFNNTGHNYGVALIIFTMIVKVLLTPLNIKQYRSSIKTQELTPQLKKLQERYKDDREKLNEEMIKLYKDNNHNPAHGCILPFLQLPIILALFQIVRYPITFMMNTPAAAVQKLFAVTGTNSEMGVVFKLTAEKGRELVESAQIPAHLITDVLNLQSGMHFLGMNLAEIPSWKLDVITGDPKTFLPLLLIPILGTVLSYVTSKIMMVATPISTKSDENQMMNANMQKSMLFMGPFFTLIFSFQVPAALGFYWSIGYVFDIIRQLYINKVLKKEKELKKEVANA